MTDFYTVLRSALDRVGAADSDQRDRVYDHVREVMVRKLRNHRPPVGEAEIASRINTFDAAIDRIEAEILEEEQAEELALQARRRADLHAARPREAPAAYDEYAEDEPYRRYADPDVDEPVDARGTLAPLEAEPQTPEPMWGAPAIDMAWDENSEQWRDARHPPAPFAEDYEPGRNGEREPRRIRQGRVTRDRADGQGRWRRRAPVPEPEPVSEPTFGDDVADDPIGVVDEEPELRIARQTSGRPPPRRGLVRRLWTRNDDGLSGPDGRRGTRKNRRRDAELEDEPPGRARKAKAKSKGRRGGAEVDEDDPIAELARQLETQRGGYERAEPLLLEGPARSERDLYLPSPERFAPEPAEDEEEPAPHRGRKQRKERKERKREDRPRRRSRVAARETRLEDEPRRRGSRIWLIIIFVFAVGVIGWAGYVFLPLLFPSEPGETSETTAGAPEGAAPVAAAAQPVTPTPAAPAGDGIVLFNGADPTVFEAGADNPVNYQGNADGGFVRITSSIDSGGARAVIGPGVAERLAGHEVRVVIEARGSPDQAAGAVRLAYQQDLLILDWRVSRLIGDYAFISASWTIPDRATDGPDYLLIEPGVAGDGTAIDIRSIRFEIVN